MSSKKLINISNLQKFLLKLNEKFALKKTMKGISEDAEGNIIIGEEGLVPTPNENLKGKFLRSDGEWALPSETAVYDSMTIEEGVAGVSEVDKVLNAKNLKQIVNSDGFLTSLDSSKLTGIINIENLPQGALERILIVSSKEERLTLLDTEVQLGDVVKESDTGMMYYVINTEKLNSEEGYTQFTAGSASSVPWSGVTDKPTIPTKTSDLTNDSGFAIDNNVVHKTGNETIEGVKTFTASPFVSNYAVTNGYFTKLNTIARNEVPSQIYHSAFRVFDKNAKTLGEYCVEKSTSGSSLLHMDVHTEDSEGNDIMESLYLDMSNDGSAVRFYPSSNNKVDLGMSNHKWAKVYSDDVVHTSGNETIAGNKTFSNQIYLGSGGTGYGQISAKDNNSILRLFGGTSASTGANLDLYGEGLNSGGFSLRARTSDKIIGLDGKVDGTLKWNGKNVALDENLVHRSGEETISGSKSFTSEVYRMNNAVDRTTTPSQNQYSAFAFLDKARLSVGSIQHCQRTSGINDLSFYVTGNSNVSYGVRINSNKEFYPIGNNTYSLGTSGNKWANVYATTFNGNLQGNADTSTSSTYATTQATTDNSTRIATTAWVRNYVNSVAGSNTVGASISAYYSDAPTKTAVGSSSSSSGFYPSDYSDYINISPTVGTIYTGSQLFGTLNASASGSQYSHTTSGSTVYYTTAKATATFSGAFSASAKYLCTTTNAVKFRAYVSQGTTSDIGTASVSDNSSAKSIFIRVQ